MGVILIVPPVYLFSPFSSPFSPHRQSSGVLQSNLWLGQQFLCRWDESLSGGDGTKTAERSGNIQVRASMSPAPCTVCCEVVLRRLFLESLFHHFNGESSATNRQDWLYRCVSPVRFRRSVILELRSGRGVEHSHLPEETSCCYTLLWRVFCFVRTVIPRARLAFLCIHGP